MRRNHSHPRRAERAAIQNRRHPKRIHRSRRPHRPRTMPARGRNANARPTTISRDNHLRSPYNSRSSGRLLSPLVSMSTSAVSCSSCTLIMRWTMGTSRPGSLYTTMSPDTKGVLYRLDKSRRSPRWMAGSILPLQIQRTRSGSDSPRAPTARQEWGWGPARMRDNKLMVRNRTCTTGPAYIEP